MLEYGPTIFCNLVCTMTYNYVEYLEVFTL